MTPAELAAHYGVSTRTVARMVTDGCPSRMVRSTRRFVLAEVEQWKATRVLEPIRVDRYTQQETLDHMRACMRAAFEGRPSPRAEKPLAATPRLNPSIKADLRQHTPAWADRDAIGAVYEECRRISEATGLLHHVDHVIPLRGVAVTGLHVENNLRIVPARENLQKNNRFDSC